MWHDGVGECDWCGEQCGDAEPQSAGAGCHCLVATGLTV